MEEFITEKEILIPNKKAMHIFYKTIIDLLEDNSNEEIGSLFRAAAMYELFGDMPDYKDRYMLSQFKRLKSDIDLSLEKWRKKSETQAANRAGGKGGDKGAAPNDINRAVKNSANEGELIVRLANIKATEEQKQMALEAFRELNKN